MKYYVIFTLLFLSIELKADDINYREQIESTLRDDQKEAQKIRSYKREACSNWKKKNRASKAKNGNKIVLLESLTLKVRPNSSDNIELLKKSVLTYKPRKLKKPDNEMILIKYKSIPSNKRGSAYISVKELKSLLGENKNPCAT